MIANIIAWCVKNKFMVLLASLALLVAGWASLKSIPLDAIPDISDTQVVVYAQWMRSPDILEDQVATPLVRAFSGAPKVKAVRAASDFGYTYVYILFEDGTDIYWARSRVLEYLSKVEGSLPQGVKLQLGPDATGVGWVYQYALVDKSGKHGIEELKSYQDWTLKYLLQSLPGVAEVSTVGGATREYQIEVNPNALSAYEIPFRDVVEAVKASNRDVGGRLLEINGAEYMVRGLGYVKSVKDLEQTAVGKDRQGTPVLVRDVARVQMGPALRRGVAELDGQGEVVGGIVTARYGENALSVIERVKRKLEEIKPGLPEGVEVVTVYDRSDLISRSIETLTHELWKLALAVALVCFVFLWNFRSAVVILLTLPLAILVAFIAMKQMGVSSNIMSLGGIALAIGTMVDAAIIMVENAMKRLEEWEEGGRKGDRSAVILKAAQEVGPSLFYTLLVITAGFIPVFAQTGQAGKLFSPLAYTKTFSMASAALLGITLTPVLMMIFLRGKVAKETENPLNRRLIGVYEPVVRWVLARGKKVLGAALFLVILTILPISRIGSEFMPDLWEGTLLYMPTTLPGLSVSEAAKVLQAQDRVLKSFPEVERVFGKIGRAETPLDPAPFNMVETTVLLKPEREWRPGMTQEKLLDAMNQALQFPGWSNALTMPIINRINMLTTGVRTPVGIKVLGADFSTIERVGKQIEQALKGVPGTRNVFAERVTGGYYVDIRARRDQVARYGLRLEDLNDIIEMAIGGDQVTETVEGRSRIPVSVRFAREFRDDVEKLKRLPVMTGNRTQVQLGQLADITRSQGPGMIRDENGFLVGYVYADIEGRDQGGYVEEAKRVVAQKVSLPPGVSLLWSGQYELLAQANRRLWVMVPLTLLLVFLLIFLNTRSFTETCLILLAVPFSLIGAFWLLWALGYNTSVAVWVGMIALAGLDAETGVVMMLYLNMAYRVRQARGRMRNREDLREAVVEGAAKRVRPKLMTVAAAWFGLVPILFSTGIGSDVMRRIAAPMVGGIFTSFLLELLVYPVLFMAWKWNTEVAPRPARGFWNWVKKVG